MDDLRSEIRAAFEKEQAAHPPLGGLRITLTAAAAAQPRPSRNLQWIAVAVAALLVILIVAGLVSTRLGPQRNVPASNPGSLKDYGPPPAGVPLIYLIDPRNNTWLQAYDWQGQPRGTIKFGKPTNAAYQSVIAAPDGSGFVYRDADGASEYLDRLGRPIAPVLLPRGDQNGGWTWADDSRHLCIVRLASPSGDWRLFTILPGEADHLIGTIAASIDARPPELRSCSVSNDRAIVLRTTANGRTDWGDPSELWVFRISDGKVLSDYKYSNRGSLEFVTASSDGMFIAENSSRSTDRPKAGAPSTVIRRVSDRSVVATLDPSLKVEAFSGDDSLVLVDNGWEGYIASWQATPLSVIDVRSGQVRWHGQVAVMTGMEQPGGRDFEITSRVSGSTETTGPLGTFMIIHGDGSVTTIPGLYTPT